MSFVKNYYPILLESLLFVCLLSLFEYVMYYIILAPENKGKIQGKVDVDIKKALNFLDDVQYSDDVIANLEKQPTLAKLTLEYIKSKDKPDLKQTGYRYYLQQLDEAMAAENMIRKSGVTILIFILFLLLFIFILYGRFIIKVHFSMKHIAYSISLTFTMIVIMQLYFIYVVSPQLKVVNNKSIEKAIYAFMLGKDLELPTLPNNNQ